MRGGAGCCQPAPDQPQRSVTYPLLAPPRPAADACRHAALPLVSRRWRQLVTSPQLLRSISVEVPRPGALKRTLALGGWLARVAAPHVEQLDVLLDPGADARILHADDLTDPTPVLTALVAGAAACSGLQRLRLNLPRSWLHDCSCACLLALPAGLQQLSISTSRVTIWEFPPGWSAAFTNLRRLVLQAAGGVSYIQPVQWAPAGLQELALDGPVKFHRNVAGFPASLTKVCLARVHAVPNQVSSAATAVSHGIPALAEQRDPIAASRAWGTCVAWRPAQCSLCDSP